MSMRLVTLRLLAARELAEHIEIKAESTSYVEPLKQPHRITRSRYALGSALHGCSTELSILEGNYLRVQRARAGGRTEEYQFDLRYADPRPSRVFRVAWAWLALGVACFFIAIVAHGSSWLNGPLPQSGLLGSIAAGCGVLALAIFLRRTTESLIFYSEHGRAVLVEVTAGIGGTRQGKPFFIDLIKSINAAKLARTQPKGQFLRDSMREHHRLRELGVLSESQYEQSKARILAQH